MLPILAGVADGIGYLPQLEHVVRGRPQQPQQLGPIGLGVQPALLGGAPQ